MLISRRSILKLTGIAPLSLASYAVAEPLLQLNIAYYNFLPPRWDPNAEPIRVVAIADIHACEPWMPISRIDQIVQLSNSLRPDLILLLGDYVSGLRPRFCTAMVPNAVWGRSLSKLSAPLGRYAVLGNHDWWQGVDGVRNALTANGIQVLENDVTRILQKDGSTFWLAGLGDQWAFANFGGSHHGVDDLPGTLSKIPDDGAPVILLAHEPDIFVNVTSRVSLTLCGHTHGGQVRIPLVGPPIVSSIYGKRYAYGHIIEQGKHMIVSGGLGVSWLPIRFGIPPEILVIDVGRIQGPREQARILQV